MFKYAMKTIIAPMFACKKKVYACKKTSLDILGQDKKPMFKKISTEELNNSRGKMYPYLIP